VVLCNGSPEAETAYLSRILFGCRNEYTTFMTWSRAASTSMGGLNSVCADTWCETIV